jgi:hypothetical protein
MIRRPESQALATGKNDWPEGPDCRYAPPVAGRRVALRITRWPALAVEGMTR